MRGRHPPEKRHRTKVMAGLHIIRKRLPALTRYYVYAWRGGPRIFVQDHTYPVVTPEILALQLKELRKLRSRVPDRENTMNGLIDDYRASPEFAGLADSTQLDYRRWLDHISEHFGTAPLAAFEDRRMRTEILTFRDKWRDRPRTADKISTMMATLLGWGLQRGRLSINIATGIRQLHKVNKADQIWEPEHWRQIEDAEVPGHLMDAFIVISLTGLRVSDAVALTWADVYPSAIKLNTKKRGARAVIPILPELRTWMEGRERTGTVLKNSRGFAWSASGLGCVFQRNKPEGFDRTMHDLRGSFATRLIMAGLTDDQAALVMGWSAKRISTIRARYVDEEKVILHLAEKLQRA